MESIKKTEAATKRQTDKVDRQTERDKEVKRNRETGGDKGSKTKKITM